MVLILVGNSKLVKKLKLSVSLEGFKCYILDRTSLFYNRHGLVIPRSSELLLCHHYPNNLKYLDMQSQQLIRSVNMDNVTLEDKFITIYIYRMLSSMPLIERYSDGIGIVRTKDLVNLQKYLNKGGKVEQNFGTVIGGTFRKNSRGDYLMYSLDEFMDNIPRDNFKGHSVQDIYTHLADDSSLKMTTNRVIYELATDIAYINELDIQDSPIIINREIGNNFRFYKELYKKSGFATQEEFTDYMLDWYLGQQYLLDLLDFATHTDIPHMMFGYLLSLGSRKPKRTFKGKRRLEYGNLVVPRYLLKDDK